MKIIALKSTGAFSMHHDHTGLRFSPSDLVTFLDSEFASWMDRWHVLQRSRPNGAKKQSNSDSALVLNGVECQRDEDDEESRLIAQKGQEHEQKFLIGLRQAGYEIAELRY
ncbi:MAG: hypothetical protein KDA68_20300 [Planctomycetaceae bacterium]|nr:hypothetical protein [Planctomycetaceae bacterium]